MTIDDIERDLPWGLHDADLRRYSVDFVAKSVTFDFDVPVDDRQERMRPGRLHLRGLRFVSVSPPTLASFSDALWINSFEGRMPGDGTALPALPEGVFLHSFLRRESGAVISIVAEDASFQWTGDEFAAGEERPVLKYPGEEIP